MRHTAAYWLRATAWQAQNDAKAPFLAPQALGNSRLLLTTLIATQNSNLRLVRSKMQKLENWCHFWCRDAIFGTKGPRRQWIIASYYDLYPKLEFEIHTIKNVEVRKLAPFLTKWRCGTIFGARRFRKQRIMFFRSITKNPNLKSV